MDNNTQIQAMKKLGMSEEEIHELLAFDKEVDRMKDKEVNNDLTDEQKKAVKKARQAERKPTVYSFSKRERKKDSEKAEIIAKIAEIFGKNAEIIKEEREISLKIGENDYSITLTKHRTPKSDKKGEKK